VEACALMAVRVPSAPSRPLIFPSGNAWRGRLVFAAISGLALIAVLGYVTFYFGCISGQEFSPDTFERRSFYYFEIPLLGWQVWPISRVDCTGTLVSHLTGEKLIAVQKKPESSVRWDLVYATRGFDPGASRPAAQGDARILCFYLDAQDSDRHHVWLEWSKKNPKLAAVLWPAVAKVCREELYLFVPELLGLASSAASLESLGEVLNKTLTDRYCELATAHQRLKRHETAIELFSEALRCTPASIPALKGRAASLQATGKTQEAASDLAEVARLQKLSAADPVPKKP